MAGVSEWGSGVIGSISGLALWGIGVLYARWSYTRNRQFSTINDEKRYRVFRKIRSLEGDGCNVIVLSMQRALYESIGMFYAHKINRYILEFIEHQNLTFSDVELNNFLKSQSLITINEDAGHVEFNEKKFNRKRWSIFAAFILVTVFFFGGAVFSLGLSKHQNGPQQWMLIGFGGTFYLFWMWFISTMLKDIGCGYGARRFCRLIAPWLSCKLVEEREQRLRQQQRDDVSEPLTDTPVVPASLLTRLLDKVR